MSFSFSWWFIRLTIILYFSRNIWKYLCNESCLLKMIAFPSCSAFWPATPIGIQHHHSSRCQSGVILLHVLLSPTPYSLRVASVILPSKCHKHSGHLSFSGDTNVTPNKLASAVSSEIIPPSPRVTCHSKSKTTFTEISLIHLKYHSTGKGENNYRTWNTKGGGENVLHLEECVCYLLPKSRILARISLISENTNKLMSQVFGRYIFVTLSYCFKNRTQSYCFKITAWSHQEKH